jgi:hypothetical protein
MLLLVRWVRAAAGGVPPQGDDIIRIDPRPWHAYLRPRVLMALSVTLESPWLLASRVCSSTEARAVFGIRLNDSMETAVAKKVTKKKDAFEGEGEQADAEAADAGAGQAAAAEADGKLSRKQQVRARAEEAACRLSVQACAGTILIAARQAPAVPLP